MVVRSLCLGVCLFVAGGCMLYRHEQEPKITYSPPMTEAKPKIVEQRPGVAKQSQQRTAENAPREWFPFAEVEKAWTAIIIHHSATDTGCAAIFDEWHKEGRNWDGVGYDFVIGNGTDSGDGEVEVTFRWQEQKTGAHCGGTAGNWANKDGIGICLVGNFDNSEPTPRQMQSLAKLVRFLQRRYDIPRNRIFGHNGIPGAHITDCPGRRFPMTRLKSMLGG